MTDPTLPANADGTSSGRVSGKVVLISGAAQGMGASHARALASEGADVIIGDVQTDVAQALAEDINSVEGRRAASSTELDVTDFASWEAAVAAAIDAYGQLDVLINNAGIYTPGSVIDAEIADWHRTIDIDLTGTFYGMKAATKELRKRSTASIINISSIAGLVGFKHRAAYSAAKWGVQGLTKTSALDLGEFGIRVNSIHPGSVTTPLTAGLNRGFGQVPAGRAAEVNEISSLVLYLASDESHFVNGSSIAIDGGETAGNNLRADS